MQDHWQISWLVFFFFLLSFFRIIHHKVFKFRRSYRYVHVSCDKFRSLVQSRSFELCFCVRYGMLRLYDQGYVRTCFPSLF